MKLSISLFVVLLLLSGGGVNAKAIRDGAQMPQKAVDAQPLKDNYQTSFFVGNVISPRDLNTVRFEVLTRHFDILTTENAMKPLYLQGEKGVFTFEIADRLVNATLGAGLTMHGHTLAWHQQSPEWMNREGIGRDEAIENLVTHAQTVAGHFRGRIVSWDVLNEAIIDNPPNPDDWKASLRQTPWYKAIGPDYIEIVFKAAREADPDTILYYNDYSLDNPSKALAVYNMVKELNEQNPDVLGRPLIDAVGMQGHYRVTTNPDQVRSSLERFISLGVTVSITELDIRAGLDSTLDEEQALRQGITYARLFSLFKEYAVNLGRVTIWGLDDGTSWLSSSSPALFDKNLRVKPAYFGALNPAAFIAENQSRLDSFKKEVLRADARYGSPSLDASDPLWQTAAAIPVNQYLMAWRGAQGSARVLWDEQNLYVLVSVTNAELNKAHPSAHEQDSVEIFIDEGNHKATYMQDDDGQYRINFDNEKTFNPPAIAQGFESTALVADRSYTIAAKIPFRTITPQENTLIGFDLQINGASARGARESVAVWNDLTGNAWQDPSAYGELRLVK